MSEDADIPDDAPIAAEPGSVVSDQARGVGRNLERVGVAARRVVETAQAAKLRREAKQAGHPMKPAADMIKSQIATASNPHPIKNRGLRSE